MRGIKRFFCLVCSLCLIFLTGMPALAAEISGAPGTAPGGEAYTDQYTIRIFPGQQGKFADGTQGLNGEGILEFQREYNCSEIISFNPNSIQLLKDENGDDSKYYVMGIRESGKDNNTVQSVAYIGGKGTFAVTQDRDYVVAYGVRGNGTYYTIRYVNAEGTQLLEEDRYYGNVGDNPVVAYRYIDGYQPQAYNLTKTLEKDETQNIFTFVYSPVAAIGGGVTTTTTTEYQDLGTTVVPGGGGAATPGGGGGAAEAEEGGGETPEEDVTIPEEETPLGPPEDLIDLDEEETPLAGRSFFDNVNGNASLLGIPIPVVIVCSLVIAGGIAGGIVYLKKRKKKEAEL